MPEIKEKIEGPYLHEEALLPPINKDLQNGRQKIQTRSRLPLVHPGIIGKGSVERRPPDIHEIAARNGIRIVKSGLTSKVGELHVGVMEDREKILEGDFLDKLAMTYRDVFGHGEPVDKTSWGEYMRCTSCGAQRSIEDVFDVSEYMFIAELEEERGIPEETCDCGCEMELFYDKTDLLQETEELIKKKKSCLAFLYDEKYNISGFSYGWHSSISQIWDEKIGSLYSHSSLVYEDFLRQIKQNSSGKMDSSTEIFYWAEIGQVLPSRNIESPFLLAGNLFRSISDEDKKQPLVVGVNSKLRSYAFVRAAGGQDICRIDDSKRVLVTAPIHQLEKEYLRGKLFTQSHRRDILYIMREEADHTS